MTCYRIMNMNEYLKRIIVCSERCCSTQICVRDDQEWSRVECVSCGNTGAVMVFLTQLSFHLKLNELLDTVQSGHKTWLCAGLRSLLTAPHRETSMSPSSSFLLHHQPFIPSVTGFSAGSTRTQSGSVNTILQELLRVRFSQTSPHFTPTHQIVSHTLS